MSSFAAATSNVRNSAKPDNLRKPRPMSDRRKGLLVVLGIGIGSATSGAFGAFGYYVGLMALGFALLLASLVLETTKIE